MISKATKDAVITAMLQWCQDYDVTHTALLRLLEDLLLVRGNNSYSATIRALHAAWKEHTQ